MDVQGGLAPRADRLCLPILLRGERPIEQGRGCGLWLLGHELGPGERRPLPFHTPALTCDGCTARPSLATLDTWRFPTNGYSIPSVRCRSSTRRDWRGSSARPHATVHRALTALLADGIAGRVSHGTAHLPSSQRYYLTAKGIGEAAETFGFATRSDFVRAYPVSRECLSLLIRRMDAVASVYRLAASLSPGIDGIRSHVESRNALESRGLRLSCHPSWVFGSSYHSLSCLAACPSKTIYVITFT